MRRTSLASITLVALALAAGCLARTSGVDLLHTQLPAKPYGCPVNRIATDAAPYAVEDLAIVTLTYTPGGKETAMKKLEEETCYYGGDTLYRVAEKPTGNGTTELHGTVARRPEGAAAPAPSASAP